MGNKCCQIEEVASILNIIKALVENVSTSISTQTAITTIQQYINHFNGNLISDFRLEPDDRTITIELANGNTFPLILDRVVDVQLNQAGTAIDITYSDASLNHSIPFPTFTGIAVNNPSNVVLSGNGTALTPLTAEARVVVQNSTTVSLSGNGTSVNKLTANIVQQNSSYSQLDGDVDVKIRNTLTQINEFNAISIFDTTFHPVPKYTLLVFDHPFSNIKTIKLDIVATGKEGSLASDLLLIDSLSNSLATSMVFECSTNIVSSQKINVSGSARLNWAKLPHVFMIKPVHGFIDTNGVIQLHINFNNDSDLDFISNIYGGTGQNPLTGPSILLSIESTFI